MFHSEFIFWMLWHFKIRKKIVNLKNNICNIRILNIGLYLPVTQ